MVEHSKFKSTQPSPRADESLCRGCYHYVKWQKKITKPAEILKQIKEVGNPGPPEEILPATSETHA